MKKKQELISEIAMDTGLTKKDITTVISAMILVIKTSLKEGDSVYLAGLGTFSTEEKSRNKRLNIVTGESIIKDPLKLPVFTSSTDDKEMGNIHFNEVFNVKSFINA